MNDETLDQSIREAIEADASTANRLVRETLQRDRPPRSPLGPVLTTAGALLLLAGAVLFMRQAPQKTLPVQTRVTNVGDTIVVRPTSGGVWLIGGDAVDAEPLAAGTVIVYKSGDGR